MNKLETLLNERLGMNLASVGEQRLNRILTLRQEICRLPHLDDYIQHIINDPEEWSAFVEEIIVPETWFFRDQRPFEFLKRYVMSQPVLQEERYPLRFLSVPCASGEEPYSIAMSLLEVGLLPHQFTIDALDISHRSIDKAKKGIYTPYSFRGGVTWNQHPFFTPVSQGYEISPHIRHLVKFYQGNLLEPLPLPYTQYDVIFCRNLLIYLNNSAEQLVINKLDRMLKNGGLLFVGSAESGKIPPHHFISLREAFVFGYRKKEPSAIFSPAITSLSLSHPPTAPQKVTSSFKPPPPIPITLKEIQLKFDQKNWIKARQLCEDYLRDYPTDELGYLLLGKIQENQENLVLAEQSFRKALYLNPQSKDSLTALINLKSKQGDTHQVNLLKQRLLRTDNNE